MARRIPKRVLARMRREGKFFSRSERQAAAEQSLRDAMFGYGKVPPLGMRVAYRAGVPVSTIAEICGIDENEAKERIVSVSEQRSDQDVIPHSDEQHERVDGDNAAAVPVDPDDAETPVKDDDNAPDLSGLSEGELTARGAELRQAGNADEAAFYDRELESRQD